MQFISPLFVLFFIIILIIYYHIPNKSRYVWLLVCSLLFYYTLDKKAIVLILGFVSITYLCGIVISISDNCRLKKYLFLLSVIGIITFLIGTKYLSFIIQNVNRLITAVNIGSILRTADFIVPIGLSYFTLSSIGYIVDVYRGKCVVEKNILKYALYLIFFPIVTAGPIERSNNFMLQIRNSPEYDYYRVKNGLILISWGFYKKVVVADGISIYVNDMFINYRNYGSYSIIIATILFSIMLYADFSGYSDIAVGIGETFGFNLIANFRQPYFAQGIRDFWRRWHISLSTWLRDYIYIPLGGNKNGLVKKYINIIIVFIVSGLWHGSGWTFLIWGLLHGIFQIVEDVMSRCINNKRESANNNDVFGNRFFYALFTFLLVTSAWFFFRVDSTIAMCEMARFFCDNLDNFSAGISVNEFSAWMLTVVPMLAVDVAHERDIKIRHLLEKQPIAFRWTCYITISIAIMVAYLRHYGLDASTFLYAQF